MFGIFFTTTNELAEKVILENLSNQKTIDKFIQKCLDTEHFWMIDKYKKIVSEPESLDKKAFEKLAYKFYIYLDEYEEKRVLFQALLFEIFFQKLLERFNSKEALLSLAYSSSLIKKNKYVKEETKKLFFEKIQEGFDQLCNSLAKEKVIDNTYNIPYDEFSILDDAIRYGKEKELTSSLAFDNLDKTISTVLLKNNGVLFSKVIYDLEYFVNRLSAISITIILSHAIENLTPSKLSFLLNYAGPLLLTEEKLSLLINNSNQAFWEHDFAPKRLLAFIDRYHSDNENIKNLLKKKKAEIKKEVNDELLDSLKDLKSSMSNRSYRKRHSSSNTAKTSQGLDYAGIATDVAIGAVVGSMFDF